MSLDFGPRLLEGAQELADSWLWQASQRRGWLPRLGRAGVEPREGGLGGAARTARPLRACSQQPTPMPQGAGRARTSSHSSKPAQQRVQ